MKVLIVSTFEQTGGAARSAHRLYRQLNRMGVDCRMLVQYKQSKDSLVTGPKGWIAQNTAAIRPYLDGLPLLFYRSRLSPPWSLAWLPRNIDYDVANYAPDVIHLHGVGHGFLPLSAISRLSKPLVWTLHDFWVFTGGCHFPGSCQRYFGKCGLCPQLNARHEFDLSRWGWQRKQFCWPQLDITFVSPSKWLGNCAHASSLLSSLPIEVIPNGIDTTQFSPGDRSNARALLGLPRDGVLLLYGAASFSKDDRKGFAFLREVLMKIGQSYPQNSLTLALFGDRHCKQAEIGGMPVRSFGSITDTNQLISLYRAADLFILPSLEENLPNTVMEAMACGLPCVAFDVGGVGELINHGANGYLAKVMVQELADGITWMLADSDRRTALGVEARHTIEECFTLTKVAEHHLALYARVLSNRR